MDNAFKYIKAIGGIDSEVSYPRTRPRMINAVSNNPHKLRGREREGEREGERVTSFD